MDSPNRYQLLIVPSDRMARRSIAPWRATLVQGLRESLRQPALDTARMASALNQLALLEAYEGKTEAALAACDAQIRFWRASAQRAGQAHHMCFVVQPWINIVRLERWRQNVAASMALYCELGPDRRADAGSLQARYGIDATFLELDRLDRSGGTARILDVVYWREYGNLLFAAGPDSELRRHLQAGMRQPNDFLRVVMLEMLLAQQIDMGNHAGALAILRRLPLDASMMYWLPFKAMEMVLAWRDGRRDAAALGATVVAAALAAARDERDERSLLQLVDIARLFERLDRPAEELVLLQAARDLAEDVGDEVLSFDVLQRLALRGQDIACDLRVRFAASAYAVVRRKLGLGAAPAHAGPDLGRALHALAELDLGACAAALDCAAAPCMTGP